VQGWISLHRQIQDNWIWKDKPFSKGQAWIDILLLASHCENKFLLGNELVDIEEGEFVTSETKLSERWGWSRHKVDSFLIILKNDSMLCVKKDNKKTTIKVLKYNEFQDIDNTKGQQKDIKRTAEGQQKDTINNVNNDNNEISNIPVELKTFNEYSPPYKLSALLENKIRKNDVGFKKQNLQKWSLHIDRLIRLDKREPKQIQDVIVFTQSDSFWMTNILSTSKLRDKYSTLLLQMEQKKSPKDIKSEFSEADSEKLRRFRLEQQ